MLRLRVIAYSPGLAACVTAPAELRQVTPRVDLPECRPSGGPSAIKLQARTYPATMRVANTGRDLEIVIRSCRVFKRPVECGFNLMLLRRGCEAVKAEHEHSCILN